MNYLEIKQKFIGYNEDFYDAIPWAQAKERYGFPKFEPRIAPSFAAISEKLRYRADNPNVYYENGLPMTSSFASSCLLRLGFCSMQMSLQGFCACLRSASIC